MISNKEKCIPCHSSCQTCSVSSKKVYTSCYEGFILFNFLCQQVYLAQKNSTLINQSLIEGINQSSKTISSASTYSFYAQTIVFSLLNQQGFSVMVQGIVISKLGFLGLVESNLPIFVFMPLKNIKDQFPSKQLSFLNLFKQPLNESLIQYFDTIFFTTDIPYDMIYNCGYGLILFFGYLVVFTLFYFLIEKVENRNIQSVAVKLYKSLICSFSDSSNYDKIITYTITRQEKFGCPIFISSIKKLNIYSFSAKNLMKFGIFSIIRKVQQQFLLGVDL
ncbi:hypothetical protein ABPG72_022183 [Tetrahymena utriculariae]